MIRRSLFATALVLAFCPLLARACTGATVTDAWVRRPPPGMTMSAAYFVVRNDGTAPLRIESISSVDFDSTMLHLTVYLDGEARMRHLEAITLAPGEEFRAAPGAAHLMIGKPRSDFGTLAVARFELHCAGGGTQSFVAPVRRTSPDQDARRGPDPLTPRATTAPVRLTGH